MSDPIEEQVSRLEDQHEPGERVKALQEWLDVELAPHRDDDGIVRVPGDRWCDILLTLLEEVARIEADAYERGRQDQHRATAEACADRRVEEEVKRAVKREQRSAGRLFEDERIAQKAIDKFEAASGLRIPEWDAGNVGDAVRAFMECRRHGKDWRLRAAPEALREAANAVEAALAAIVGEDGQDG